ncbi:MAG: histidine phosphatase family protein [Xanthomonadales bacterium]|nr:histidine phosphatase family protein [Xanthomonadales bacterium]
MSKLLYLVRHAKSSWSDPSLSDRDRPLNKRGRRSAPDMGRRLAAQDHLPELIISSPARRAFSTARKIAKKLGYDRSKIMTDESLYFSGTGSMMELLENLDDDYQKVMIVGHNPAMTSLMNILSGSSIDNMPTCAVAVINYPMTSWSELRSTDGQLLAYDFPKNPVSSSE